MKVCFIGACGHWQQAYNLLKSRKDIIFSGFAPGSEHEPQRLPSGAEMPLYDDYKTMLDCVKPELAIVSPVFGLTGRVILDCAARKIDVFSEKPVAASITELTAVRDAVKASEIRFCAMHYLRFAPAFYNAAKMVREGAIGEVKLITAQKSYKFGQRPEWYRDRSLYAGTIPWVGIHAIDWISAFTGRRFLSVTAQSDRQSPEMTAICGFTLEGNLPAAANIDYYRPAGAPSHGDDRVRCVGEKGIIEVTDDRVSLLNADGAFSYSFTEAPDPLELFLEHKDVISPQEIFHITAAALCAREAADSGRQVNISEVGI